MQIIVIIFFVIILFIILLLSLSNGEDQKRIAGKEGELQAKKILNHYLNENDSMGDYRRMIRSALNTYSHCTPEQVNWNIYLESTQDNCCTMELNTKPMVININAYYIDRYICIHLYEVINVIFEVYNDYFKSQLNLKRQLQDLSGEITIIIEDFLRFINEEKLDISVAPELLRIKR